MVSGSRLSKKSSGQLSGKRKEPKPKLFGLDIFSWGGGLPREGVPKTSECPSKPRENKLLGGLSRDFWRDIPGAPEKFEKKTNYVQSLDPKVLDIRLGDGRRACTAGVMKTTPDKRLSSLFSALIAEQKRCSGVFCKTSLMQMAEEVQNN